MIFRALDRNVRRLLWWTGVAAVSILATIVFGWTLADKDIRLLLAPKLPYLGLVMAVATFQHRALRDVAQLLVGKALDSPDLKSAMRKILLHHEAILTNLLFVSACLLGSVCADVALLIAGKDVSALRVVSTSLLIVSFLPFFEVLWRYLGGLLTEFKVYREALK